MKPKLIILSDLWGANKSDWAKHYMQQLEGNFEIKYYDCCTLGSVHINDYSEESLHKQFVDFGIETAVAALNNLEKEKVYILAFSVGGVIGWKYALTNTNVQSFVAVSSTRLRYEIQKPNTEIELYFGEKDNYKPSEDWFNKMGLAINLHPNVGHEVYKNEIFVDLLCNNIKNKLKQAF